ncbi:MAG TPA: hypothetical protein VF625_17085 [Longimicrobium sp.]|jgi:hypothetical protein
MQRLARLTSSFVALCLAASACADVDPFANRETAADGGPSLEIFAPPIEVDVLQRTTAITQPLQASAVIGKDGGRLEIPGAGLRVDFPTHAVRGNTRITVTAVPGTAVAYVFEPHGLVFRQPVQIRQTFKGTNAEGNHELRKALEGAYFTATDLLSYDVLKATGVAKIVETRPTEMEVNGSGLRFSVEHFSGYLVSTGRRSGYISSTGNRIPVR